MFSDLILTIPYVNSLASMVEQALNLDKHPANPNNLEHLTKEQIQDAQCSAGVRFVANLISTLVINTFVACVFWPALIISLPVTLFFNTYDLSSLIYANSYLKPAKVS